MVSWRQFSNEMLSFFNQDAALKIFLTKNSIIFGSNGWKVHCMPFEIGARGFICNLFTIFLSRFWGNKPWDPSWLCILVFCLKVGSFNFGKNILKGRCKNYERYFLSLLYWRFILRRDWCQIEGPLSIKVRTIIHLSVPHKCSIRTIGYNCLDRWFKGDSH